jgi:cytochrome P450
MDLSHPLFTLDPFAADARAEAKRLLEAGPVVPVDVVGAPVWAITRHAVAQQIFEDPSFSTGHDPAQHGPLAASFDVARDTRHLSFGHGPHFCVGAPLAHLEAHVGLPAYVDRFDAELAVPRDGVEPGHSPALNGVRAVPAIIRPRQEAVAGG